MSKNFTDLNSKEMDKVNGGSAVVTTLGPVLAPVIAYALIKRFIK